MASKVLYKVFVYGTLKKGEPNHHWFSKSTDGYHKFLYNAQTKEKYPLIIGTRYNVPFILHSPGNGHNARGEVYEVDNKVLSDLDILEDHPNYYIREEYEVENIDTKSRKTEKVWIYMIKAFRKELLNQTFYENYSNFGEHGLKYVPSEVEVSSLDDLQ
ncbi:putative gamma-glutamylcyclotransferase CG2811 isoform X2 [Sitophilus oryzae]|uniref:Gamma-glutamylcyclotransferase family protein n=1 Tax=Sitophilus oryzae TaxID=7048 RepID=A0A6J2XJ80_SITOR|nr:putative gamma-glutamylcyclotransferase CG2811 isoform X2 [Sitophilus oryzae]